MQSGPPELRLRVHGQVASDVREQLRTWLEDAGASEAEIFQVQLASTEVFANAIEHPKTPTSDLVEFHGTISPGALVTVAIRDHGNWRNHTAHEERGLGLVIVEELMDSFRVEFCEDGPVVTMQRQLRTD